MYIVIRFWLLLLLSALIDVICSVFVFPRSCHVFKCILFVFSIGRLAFLCFRSILLCLQPFVTLRASADEDGDLRVTLFTYSDFSEASAATFPGCNWRLIDDKVTYVHRGEYREWRGEFKSDLWKWPVKVTCESDL